MGALDVKLAVFPERCLGDGFGPVRDNQDSVREERCGRPWWKTHRDRTTHDWIEEISQLCFQCLFWGSYLLGFPLIRPYYLVKSHWSDRTLSEDLSAPVSPVSSMGDPRRFDSGDSQWEFRSDGEVPTTWPFFTLGETELCCIEGPGCNGSNIVLCLEPWFWHGLACLICSLEHHREAHVCQEVSTRRSQRHWRCTAS